MKIRLLSSVMLSLLCSFGTAQTAVKVDGVNYLLNSDDGTAQIANNSGVQGAVIIPDSILYNERYYQVTSMANLAFSDCEKLESVVLPATLKEMNGGAFLACFGLRLIDCRMPEPIRMKDGNNFTNAMKFFGTLRVPSKSRNAYRHHADWSEFANIEEDNAGKDMVDVHVRCNDLGTVTLDGKQVKGQDGKTADLWLEAERGSDLTLAFTSDDGLYYQGSETEVSLLVINGDTIPPFSLCDNSYRISQLQESVDIDVAFSLTPRQLLVRQAEGGCIGIRYDWSDSVTLYIESDDGAKATAVYDGMMEPYWINFYKKGDNYYNFGQLWKDTELEVSYEK